MGFEAGLLVARRDSRLEVVEWRAVVVVVRRALVCVLSKRGVRDRGVARERTLCFRASLCVERSGKAERGGSVSSGVVVGGDGGRRAGVRQRASGGASGSMAREGETGAAE